jgi:ATP-dependent Clp protease ATP-binding subunit ClpB
VPASAARDLVMAELRALVSPELLNRIDEVIMFNRLEARHMLAIVDIQLRGAPPFFFFCTCNST